MIYKKITANLKKCISRILNDKGALLSPMRISFAELYRDQDVNDWDIDFCLKMFNEITEQQKEWVPNNKVCLKLKMPLQDVDNLRNNLSNIEDFTAILDKSDQPEIFILLHENPKKFPLFCDESDGNICIVYCGIYKKRLDLFDSKVEKQRFAFYTCYQHLENYGYERFVELTYCPDIKG